MKKINSLLALAGLFVLFAARSGATTITGNFTNNPSLDGWRIFGDTNLFQWDSANQNLAVTWDSSQTNGYFYHPLGTVLTRYDDFSIAFDLRLHDIGMNLADPIKTNSFELAIGFLNLGEATQTSFLRGTGYNSPDLVEFDYFWDSGYGATVWPAFVDTFTDFNYNSSSDYAVFALTPDDWYHVVMTYTASNQTLVTTLTNFEQTAGVSISQLVNDYFGDYRVDAISISSYSDAGQDPTYGEGSILAHGTVGNFAVTVPPPPVQNLAGAFSNGVWQAQFTAPTNWLYTLQRSADFQAWTNVSPATPGTGTNLFLPDASAPAGGAFYRIEADRP